MAHATTLNQTALLDVRRTETPAASTARKSLWTRLVDAIFTSREKQAEDEIARYLARSGGTLTDSIEREITVHALTGGRRMV